MPRLRFTVRAGGRGWWYSATPVVYTLGQRNSGVAKYRQPRPPARHTILALALLTSIGCGSEQEAEPQAAVPRIVESPVEAPYTIISDGDEGSARRQVEVKLNRKVTHEVLREIALKVKGKEERKHERTLIYYYLPVEFPELAGQAWASTHFNPVLNIKILGLSMEEEAAMRKIPLDHKGKRIGAWLPDDQYKTLDLIYDEAGTIKIAEIRSPTERSVSDMIEKPSTTGRRFQKVKGSNFYDVDYAGNLRISNVDGQVLLAAKKMR
jgi:hypothetical protein